jgi:hypothetical protein
MTITDSTLPYALKVEDQWTGKTVRRYFATEAAQLGWIKRNRARWLVLASSAPRMPRA